MNDWFDRPETFLGMSYSTPHITTGAVMTTLNLPRDRAALDEIAQREAERHARGIGFNAPMHQENT
jgi:hypothetical protein